MNADILIVDDDRYLARGLERLLAGNGFAPRLATDFTCGIREVELRQPDLMILDLGLPDGDGITLCRRLRTKWHFPVLMLTSRNAAMDKVIGLEVGADDYVSKPFEASELLARIRALLRRAHEYGKDRESAPALLAGKMCIDLGARSATFGDQRLNLTETEIRLLALLVQNSGRAIGRDSLFESVWGYEPEFGSNSLDVFMYRLRRKLAAAGAAGVLKTVRGFGYMFTGAE
ncbi:MAG: response regulator transcription factor [Fimbriimonadaceae bacterium]